MTLEVTWDLLYEFPCAKYLWSRGHCPIYLLVVHHKLKALPFSEVHAHWNEGRTTYWIIDLAKLYGTLSSF